MKIKSLLILVLSLVTLTAFGQDGGIKGRVVSRAGRIALGDVKITMTPGGTTTVSDAQGNFVFENIPAGEYSLQFETPEFETSNIAVRVGSQMRDINAVILVPDTQRQMIDDAVFAEFDTETTDDGRLCPRRSRLRKISSIISRPTSSAKCVSTSAVTIRSIRTCI